MAGWQRQSGVRFAWPRPGHAHPGRRGDCLGNFLCAERLHDKAVPGCPPGAMNRNGEWVSDRTLHWDAHYLRRNLLRRRLPRGIVVTRNWAVCMKSIVPFSKTPENGISGRHDGARAAFGRYQRRICGRSRSATHCNGQLPCSSSLRFSSLV